ncbi:MAG: rod shape-determining protein MreD [Candidatus Omnitrophica bacterium CG1_02_46_14]|nr:MAG: rod shape-determining protein MreD [Candidatus Omnitrophica bacterium CG1_02_46_14]
MLALFWIVVLFLMQEMIGIFFPNGAPPLMLIGVIYYALIEGPVFGAVSGCLAGFLLDILGVGKLGTSMAILSGLGMISGLSASKIFYDGFLTQFLLPLIGNYLFCFLSLFFYRNLPEAQGLSMGLFRDSLVLSQPILTLLISPVIFSWMKKAGPRR